MLELPVGVQLVLGFHDLDRFVPGPEAEAHGPDSHGALIAPVDPGGEHHAFYLVQRAAERLRVRPEASSSLVRPGQEIDLQFVAPERCPEPQESEERASCAEDPARKLLLYDRGEREEIDDPRADQHEDHAGQGAVGEIELPVVLADEVYLRSDHAGTI